MDRAIIITNLVGYLETKDIIEFSKCNKTIYKALNPENNIIINGIYMQKVVHHFFEFDNDNYFKDKQQLLSKFFNYKKNWKSLLKKLTLSFKQYNDKAIAKKVLDCFKIHIFLSYIRRENIHLEYELSSIHLIVNYDLLFRNTCTYNFYSKFITKEYILDGLKNTETEFNNNNNTCIKILKEGLFFEKELKNFNIIFKDYIHNNKYKQLIAIIANYDFEKLEFLNKGKSNNIFDTNKYNNNIINLLLSLSNSFILYSYFVYEYINNFNEQIDEKTLLNEYLDKIKEITNCSLLLSSNFQNINIIINHFIKYQSFFQNNNEEKEKVQLILSQKSSSSSTSQTSTEPNINNNLTINSGKFSLYKLFLNIINKNVKDKLFQRMNENFKKLAERYSSYLFDNFKKILEEQKKSDSYEDIYVYDHDDDNSKKENQNIINEEDEKMDDITFEKEQSDKEIIENYILSEVDKNINEYNANAINHTGIKFSKEYKLVEILFINTFVNTLKDEISKDKDSLYLFEVIEKMTGYNDSNNFLCNSNSFCLIRRTKKLLMEQSVFTLLKKVKENLEKKFLTHIIIKNNKIFLILNNNEIKNKKEYQPDLSDLSLKKRMKVVTIVENEINNLKSYLIDKNTMTYYNEETKNEIAKIINEYINCEGIPEVYLIKRMIWFYYKQLGFYEENNEKIVKILINANDGQDSINILDEKTILDEQSHLM